MFWQCDSAHCFQKNNFLQKKQKEMKANEVLLRVRSRLRDNNFTSKEGVKFNDAELIDALNDTALKIVKALKINIRQAAQILTPSKQTLFLQKTPCAIIKATYNGAQIPISTQASIITNPPKNTTLYPISPRQYALAPSKAEGIIEIWASFFAPIKNADDELELDDSFCQLLVYGVLERIFQIETNENNLQRVKFYASEFARELANISDLLNKTSEGEAWQTKCKFY